jgi:hypothetical protein
MREASALAQALQAPGAMDAVLQVRVFETAALSAGLENRMFSVCPVILENSMGKLQGK